MCDPTGGIATMAITSAVIGGASSVLGSMGQGQKYNQNVEAATANYDQTNDALSQQSVQVDAQHSENAVSNIIEGAKNSGRVSASASSLGGGASSTAAQENAADFSVGREGSINDLNAQNKQLQIGADRQNSGLAFQSQVNSVAAPSAASLVLGLGDAALKGASTYSSLGGKF